jgi:flagellar P-ring protein precursor FlgI
MRTLLFILLATVSITSAGVRIGDLTDYPNTTPVTLTGYGLIVGLAGTGDGSKSTFTPQTFATMLKQFGIEVAPDELKLKNVAAVMVSCEMPAGSRRGSRLDALVSSLGDATSLQGGTLLRAVLNDPWGNSVAEVQGPVSIGGFNFETGGNRISRNHSVAGRIPSGVHFCLKTVPNCLRLQTASCLMLEQPDLRMAVNITKAINANVCRFGAHRTIRR